MGRGEGKESKRSVVTHDIEQFRDLLSRSQPFLSRRKSNVALEEFDAEAEELIVEVFGKTSELLDTYEYAKTGRQPRC